MNDQLINLIEDSRLKLIEISKNCKLCPNCCGVNRTKHQLGFCNSDNEIKVASINLHKGEEPPISGENGSINMFFSNCSMNCVYCQNYPISQMGVGKIWAEDEAVAKILRLKKRGNNPLLNFVTPTHQIVSSLPILSRLVALGWNTPFVYNTSGFENRDVIDILSGIFKIFLWDIRYFSNELGLKYSNVNNYYSLNMNALSVLVNKLGDKLLLNSNGMAKQGIILRLLVLPDNVNRVDKILASIKHNFGNKISISLMNQYFPSYKAFGYPEINKKTSEKSFNLVREILYKYGFKNGWIQEFEDGNC